MPLLVVGLSHRTAPVELRERVDFSRSGVETALSAIAARRIAREAVVLSTCNRAEVYAAVDLPNGGDDPAHPITRFFSDYHGVPYVELTDHFYVHRGAEAARHLFRVSAGLDSLVVGEPQILGQVKAAYSAAGEGQFTGALTNRLFHSAFAVGKRVRSETGLAEGAVSVSYAAIALAKKIFGNLEDLHVLILGTGDMAKLTGRHLHAQRVREIAIAGRSPAACERLAAEVGGHAVAWSALREGLGKADIVVTATGASDPVVTRAMVHEAMRARRTRPLFIIDIAVPRDVEASAGDLDQVFLYDIDDLQAIVKENLSRRRAELDRADAIVSEEVARFASWMQSREIIPTVVALRQRFEAIRKAELTRLEPKLAGLPPEARARLDEITHLIIEKLLLTPTEQLKAISDEAMMVLYSEALNRLFSLAVPDEGTESSADGATRSS